MPGAEGEKADDLRLRHILCEYLSLAASIVLARAEDSIGISVGFHKTLFSGAKMLIFEVSTLLGCTETLPGTSSASSAAVGDERLR